MVAVDEASYNRVQAGSSSMPDFGLNDLFKTVGDTADPSVTGYAADLRKLQDKLKAEGLNYRIFTTNVSLKTAKWSRQQVD